MPQFKYVDDVPRIFPGTEDRPALIAVGRTDAEIGHIAPGDVVEADSNPHPTFFEEVTSPVKRDVAPKGD